MLRKFVQGFMRDDLFIRVLLTLSSALLVAVAVALIYGVLLMPYPLWGHVVAGCFVLLMFAWALLLVAGAFSFAADPYVEIGQEMASRRFR